MATTRYIDASTFAAAKGIFTDATLGTAAPTGYYKEPSGTTYRYWDGTTLLAPLDCPTCGGTAPQTVSYAAQPTGIFDFVVNVGTSTGAVAVSLDLDGAGTSANAKEKGLFVTYNSVTYSAVTTNTDGYLEGPYFARTASSCSPDTSSPLTLPVSEYNFGTTSFDSTSTSEIITIAASDIDKISTVPTYMNLIVPKTSATEVNVNVRVVVPCTDSYFSVTVAAPAALSSFSASTVQVDSITACAQSTGSTLYYYDAASLGNPTQNYWAFQDANGVTPAANGFYKVTGNNYIEVTNGVITTGPTSC